MTLTQGNHCSGSTPPSFPQMERLRPKRVICLTTPTRAGNRTQVPCLQPPVASSDESLGHGEIPQRTACNGNDVGVTVGKPGWGPWLSHKSSNEDPRWGQRPIFTWETERSHPFSPPFLPKMGFLVRQGHTGH